MALCDTDVTDGLHARPVAVENGFPFPFFLVLTPYLTKFWKNLTSTIVKIKTQFFKELYRDSWCNDGLIYFHLLRIQSKVT